MGSIGHLRPIQTSQQQQPQQHQPIDMKPIILTTNNNTLHSSPLPTPNSYMNDLSITSTLSATATTTITNTLSDSENNDINNFMVPKSLKFIINRLSKVREEITTIEKNGQVNNTCSILNSNFQQDVENNHNISNSNNDDNIVKEDITTHMNYKNNTINDIKKSYTIARSIEDQGNMKCDKRNCQDTNNSSDSTLSQNEMSSSSSSSSTSSASTSSSHSVSVYERLDNQTQNKDVKSKACENDSHSHRSKTSIIDQEEEEENETIDVDEVTLPTVEPTNKSSSINDCDLSPSTRYKNNAQPPEETTEDTIMILKQLMDKRIEIKRLDKMVFNLITHHLMKITPTNSASISQSSSKSILPTSYNYRPLSPNTNYSNHSSLKEDCPIDSNAIKKTNDNVDDSNSRRGWQQCASIGCLNIKDSVRTTSDHQVHTTDYLSSTKNTSSSPNNLNVIENSNGSQSLIDLTTASSRQHRNTITPDYNSATGNNKQIVSDQQLNNFVAHPKDDNLCLSRQKILNNINLADYDGLSEALRLTGSIYGRNRDIDCSSEVLKCSTRSNDECKPMTGLNLKTTNTKSSIEQCSSLLKDMHHSAQSLLPMASTSFNLHAVAGLHNSHYRLNANLNNINRPISHHSSTLDLFNKQACANLPSVPASNDFGLNYPSQSREQIVYATSYQPINPTSNGLNNLDQRNSKTLSSASSNQHGESLLRPPVNKKFRTSFSQPATMNPNEYIDSNMDENHQKSNYLYDRGSLDYHHQQSSSHQDLDLQHKHCQKLLQQQIQNSTLTTSAASTPSPSPSSSLLAYQQSQRQYHYDFVESLSLEENNSMKSNSNNVDNNSNGINNNSGICRLVCHVCGSGFEDRHRLQQHLSIHLQLKPEWYSESTIKETMAQYEAKRGDYLCGQCDVRFDTTAEFDKHMQLHGDKPHRCELCFHDNSFRYWRQYLTHFRNHCFVYHCRFVKGCNHQCNRRDYLKSHILKHHLDNKLPEQYTG